MKKVSDNGLNFISKEEGIVLHPYLDSVGIPTIGVGCTYYEDGTKVNMSDPPITRERAIALFKIILSDFEVIVNNVVRQDINQNQFDSLVSLSYNIGMGAFKRSTVLKKVNANPGDPEIRRYFEMWKNAGGKPILLNRRKREANLYFKPPVLSN